MGFGSDSGDGAGGEADGRVGRKRKPGTVAGARNYFRTSPLRASKIFET